MTKIIIIGAGIIGATIAYELSLNPQYEITLLEQETAPALHSSGAALGVLMGFISHKIKGRGWKLRQQSLERYNSLIPELEKLTEQTINFNQQGILKLLFPEDSLEQWQKLISLRKNQGYHLEIWDKNQVFKNCPHVEINDIIGAIYSPQDRQVNPTELTQTLIKGAKINGVECKFGVKVQKLLNTSFPKENNINCEEVLTSEGNFKADFIIITAGLGTKELTQNFPQPLDLRPVLGQALQVKINQINPQFNPDFQPVITGNDVHIVPLKNNEFWIGATVEFPNEQGEIIMNQNLLEEVKKAAFSYCPFLENHTIIKQWFGQRPRPENRPAPIIEKLTGTNNIFLATGHYRNGILLAPATAILIKNYLENQLN